MNLCIYLVRRNLSENAELLRLEERDCGFINSRVFTFEEAIKPDEGVDAKLLCVVVRAFGDLQAEVFVGVVKFVDVSNFLMNAEDAVEREYIVFVTIGD